MLIFKKTNKKEQKNIKTAAEKKGAQDLVILR